MRKEDTEYGEKYHMKSQYDVVSYILLSMSDLLISVIRAAFYRTEGI